MNTHPLGTRDDIVWLVDTFYDQIRTHPELGPIFNTHIQNWPEHLGIMVRFWSSLLLRTGDFDGSPMIKHARLPDLSAHLFEQWLQLFQSVCAQHANTALGARAWEFSQRVARSLWMGYQIQQHPEKAPSELDLSQLAS